MKQESTRLLLTETMWSSLWYLPWPGSSLNLLQGSWLPLPLMQIYLKILILFPYKDETLMNPLYQLCVSQSWA